MEIELNDVFLVPRDGSCCMRPGWMYDFNFGYGLDVIEEDAMNEKFCIQVLRIMITKADAEIDELEKDLAFLQSELAWAEYDEWSEICCNTLRKKVDCLYVTVTNVKNKDKEDVEVSLLMHKKPAENVHEIVKDLLDDYFQEKDKQVLDAPVLDSSNPPGRAAELLEESTKCSSSDSYAIVKEEIQEPSITPKENGVILNTSFMLQEKKANHSATVKLVNGAVKGYVPQSLKEEAVQDDNMNELGSFDLKSAGKEEANAPGFSFKDEKKFQNLSLKSPDKRRNNQDMFKVQPAGIMFKYLSRNSLKRVASQSKKKKFLSTSDQKLVSEQVEENSSTSEADVIGSDSSSKPMGKSENLGEMMKPVNAVMKDSDSNACRQETGLDKGITTMWKSELKVGRNEEVSTCQTTSTVGVEISESSANPEGKGTPREADKPPTIILQNIGNDALSQSSGLSQKNNNSDSRLAISSQAKGGNSDISLDASKHMSSLSGSRNNSDSCLAISRKEKGGNSDGNPDALQHATDPSERRSNSDSALPTVRQFKVGKCDVSPASEHTTGLNQRKNHSYSSLGASRQAKGQYRDMDQKLCDLAQKSARKRHSKESNFTLTDKIDSSHSSSEAEGKRRPFQLNVKFEKTGLSGDEHSALTSFLELQDEKDATNAQPDEGKVQPEKVKMGETAANDEKFDLDSCVKPQKRKAKRKIESNPTSVKGPGFLSIELVSGSSLISKAKRQLKSGLGSDSGSNQCLDREAMKKITDHQCEAEETSAALDDGRILISQPQKKRKKNSSLPILVEIKGSTLETDLSRSHSHPNDSAGKDDLTESYSFDSCTEAVASSCFATSKLKKMKLGDLRTIAKEQKLRKYSKLRKSDLIERIANHLGCC